MPSELLAVFKITAVLIALALCLPGCRGNVNRAQVSGKVTLDGEPLPSGLIEFVPAPGTDGPPVQIQIIDGVYSSPAITMPTVGKNFVQITATKKTGKKTRDIMGIEADEVLQYIPAKYNESSELIADIKATRNVLDFNLLSD